jgi:hypothetical protein
MSERVEQKAKIARISADVFASKEKLRVCQGMDQVLQGAALRLGDDQWERFGSGHSESSFFGRRYFYDCPM